VCHAGKCALRSRARLGKIGAAALADTDGAGARVDANALARKASTDRRTSNASEDRHPIGRPP